MSDSLYSIAEEFRLCASRLSDLDLPEDVIADTLEAAAGTFEQKAANVAAVIKSLLSESEAINAAIAEMQKRSKAKRARAESVKQYLLDNMLSTGITKIECPYFKIAVRENPEAVILDCEAEIPSDYWREIPATKEPDKTLIKKAIKDGLDVPGVHLSRSSRVDIK